ncbi:MAG: chromate transporter [Treponema sp.]|nr:chromate transporter [Treponema sp.]
MSSLVLTGLVFWEFFKIGLFAVGGGPATLPYLMELSDKFNWFTMEELTNMIAVSESTPGPLGINMATYVGYQTLGIWGGVVATLGLVTPSLIIICLIAAFFNKFNSNKIVQSAFSAIRPAVTAIIAVSVLGICRVTLFTAFDLSAGLIQPLWHIIIFAVVILGLLQFKKLKKIHPFLWFVVGAIVGIVFKF